MAISLKKFLICLQLLLLPAACSVADTTTRNTAAVNQAESTVKPKVVVQLGHQKLVRAVQWINEGSNLVSLGEDGSIMFWDASTGSIVDHAQVPLNGDPDDLQFLWFQDFRLADDRKSISIFYHVAEDGILDSCPLAGRGKRGWCSYSLNLGTRKVKPDGGLTPPETFTKLGRWDEGRNFPLSPDGQWRPVTAQYPMMIAAPGVAPNDRPQADDSECDRTVQCDYPINLVAVSRKRKTLTLHGNPRSLVYDVDVSADGRQLVKLEALEAFNRARVEALDLASGSAQLSNDLDRHYDQVWALSNDRYALHSNGDSPGTTPQFGVLQMPPTLLVDRKCMPSGSCPKLQSYEQMTPFGEDGSFLGVAAETPFFVNPGLDPGNLEDCQSRGGDPGTCADANGEAPSQNTISINLASDSSRDGKWRVLAKPDWQEQEISAIRASPDRSQLAVATWESTTNETSAGFAFRVWLFEVIDNAVQSSPRELIKIDFFKAGEDVYPLMFINRLEFTPDGDKVVFTQINSRSGAPADLYVVDTRLPGKVRKYPNFSSTAAVVSNGRIFGLDTHELIDADSGKSVALGLGEVNVIKAGVIGRSQLFWTATVEGALEFRDSNDGSLQLTLNLFPGNRFFAVTPGGRYDTNLGPDTNLIRWLVPDAPWQSLGPQTFMRDFYEPGLYRKLLDCRQAENCGEVFKQLPSIESLNRVLPAVAITGVRPGKDASEAIVSVEVRAGESPDAANGKTRSGIFNPRVYRNGRVVAMNPDKPDAVTDSLEKWRNLNDVSDKTNPAAPRLYEFAVPLPTASGTERQEFSAYAFNEDRIKSETATFTYQRPPVAPRKPKAFVVTIGIDDYDTERFRLHYAVADARLIAGRLHDIPGYEMHRLTLAGERLPDGTRKRVDNTTIMRVLSLVMTNDGRSDGLARLRTEDGVDASMLEQATPDDIVIVSFSGHGWADPMGNFYLVPTNGYFIEDTGKPELRSLFATAELTMYFRAIDAAEITLIIDACHSSASVANAGFKPGPMGDSGLGQLAYDKGIRILAATQADDVAMEDQNLGQGLLSYALAAEGLTATGGKADIDGDKVIGLDEWLRYGEQRLPGLSNDLRLAQIKPGAGGARAIEFHDLAPNAAKRRVQKPSLFDFNAAPSRVVLRDRVR